MQTFKQQPNKGNENAMSILNLMCPTCLEPLRNADDLYSTSCGHVFHFRCLRDWQSRSTSCPKCQDYKPLTHKLYLSFDEYAPNVKDLTYQLEQSSKEIQDLKSRLYERNLTLVNHRVESEKAIGELKNLVTNLKSKIVCLEGTQQKQRQQILSLTQEISSYEAYSETAVNDLNKENDNLKKDLEKISTELAIEVSKNQQKQTANGPIQIVLHKDKIEALEQKLKHISEEFEKEITKSTQLQIDNMKLKNLIQCMKCIPLTMDSENLMSRDGSSVNDVKKEQPSVSSHQRSKALQQPQHEAINNNNFHSNAKDIAHAPQDSEQGAIQEENFHSRATDNAKQMTESTANSIVIQNIPSGNLIHPLESTVMFLASIMNIYLKKADIDKVYIMGGQRETVSLYVKFISKKLKTNFLTNKYRLNKSNSAFVRMLQIKEYFDERINELFNYAKKKLLNNGFSNVFLTNNEIFVKNTITDKSMKQIFTWQQVDELLNNNSGMEAQ